MITRKLQSNEVRQIPVIFLPFLNQKKYYSKLYPLQIFLCALFRELDPFPRKFLVARLVLKELNLVFCKVVDKVVLSLG